MGKVYYFIMENRFNNNFDFLRFIAASMVIFNHTYYWLGISSQELLSSTSRIVSFGSLGVAIFFIISGYLITKSWDKNRSIVQFFWNRILRIVPGLITVSLFSILVVGPLVTQLNIVDYFLNINTWGYLRTATIYLWWPNTLPGIVQGINGVLWTLPIEFTMYIFIGIAGFIGILYSRKLVLLVYGLCIIFYGYLITFPLDEFIASINLPFITPRQSNIGTTIVFVNLMSFFLSGTIFYLYRDHIKFGDKKTLIISFILSLIIVLSNILYLIGVNYFFQISTLCFNIFLPYITLCIAFLPIKKLNTFGAKGDFSYGLYIYGWPVQLFISYYFAGRLNLITGFIVFFLITLFLAYLSWNLVEKRALELKKINIEKSIKLFKEKVISVRNHV